tara:strand:- start:380 stop:556 length:177 start_codon:yes stop_codon:yes gene_type:complete
MKLTSRSRGLGDTVEKITTVTGIKKVADTIAQVKKGTGECTPCQKRRDALNRLFPYQK